MFKVKDRQNSCVEPFEFLPQTAKVSSEINTAVSHLTEYELSMDLSQTTGIEREHSYFFRIGALSSTSEAKYNYSPAVEIDL